MNLYFLTLCLYSASLLVLAGFFLKRVGGSSDFFVASRELGTGLLFSTLLAANIGAGSTVGAAGLGYRFGLSAWWWVGSAGLGSLLLAFTVGPRLWKIASELEFLTVGDYLEHRYDARVRATISVLIWIGALAILSGQLIAMAWVLKVVAGTPKWLGCLLGGFVVTAYFSLGGLVAAARVNAVQLVVKMAGFVLAVLFALNHVDWWNGLATELAAKDGRTLSAGYLSLGGNSLSRLTDYIVVLVPAFIVSPGILQKVYGARSARVARNAVLLNALCLLLFAVLPPMLGMTARLLYPELPNAELALPTVMLKLLPPWLGTLALAAVFSAELSSADAVLAMLATSLAKDLVKGHFRTQMTDGQLLRLIRGVSLVAGALGILAAIMLPTVISALQVFYSLLTVGLFVPLVAGLYWKNPDAVSALAAIAAGVGTSVGLGWLRLGQGIDVFSPVGWGIIAGGLALLLFTEGHPGSLRDRTR